MVEPALLQLQRDADQLSDADPSWLLNASALSDAVCRVVTGDTLLLDSVRVAIRDMAVALDCDLIVGASSCADLVVRDLSTPTAAPSRALLFDLVRVTGAAISQARLELRHIEVVPAVLMDLGAGAGTVQIVDVRLQEPLSC